VADRRRQVKRTPTLLCVDNFTVIVWSYTLHSALVLHRIDSSRQSLEASRANAFAGHVGLVHGLASLLAAAAALLSL